MIDCDIDRITNDIISNIKDGFIKVVLRNSAIAYKVNNKLLRLGYNSIVIENKENVVIKIQ